LKKRREVLSKYFPFSKEHYEKFELFYRLHHETVHNLTAIKERSEFFLKHILDSVYFVNYLSVDFESAVDVGSGGGFPGIVLSVYFPEKKFYLVESITKKCIFLSSVISKLGLDNVDVINSRVENVSDLKVDLIISRGVGKVFEILKLTANVSRETTAYIFYKGENIEDELHLASKVLKKRGLKYGKIRVENPILRTYLYLNSISCPRVCPKTL
jgi:16S rRNA (guanine527-N7)-methyltransferase